MMTGLNCKVAVAAGRRHRGPDPPAQHARERGHRGGRGGRGGRARRRHRAARVGRRRAGDQARLLDPRPGGQRGRVRHPLRARRGRHAGPLPRRRRAQRGRAGAEADDLRRRLADQDHERARHRREAGAAGRPRQRQRRGTQGRPAGHDPADPARRGGDDPHPRQGAGAAHARRARHGRRGPAQLLDRDLEGPRRGPGHRADRLGQVDDALRGAHRGQRRREEHHHDRGPGRVPDRRASTRSTSTARRGSTSPPACARSCAPTPTSSWSARSATPRPRGSRSSPRSPATWCSRPCTPTTPRGRSPGWRRWGSRASSPPRRSTASSPSASPASSAPTASGARSLPQAALDEAGFRVGADVEAYEPVGCGRCNRTGYRGRIGLFSVMGMTEEIKELTIDGAPEAEITAIARERGHADPARGRPRQGRDPGSPRSPRSPGSRASAGSHRACSAGYSSSGAPLTTKLA